jgi:FtsP/CotA-like multicopper oxidase with cupredoxin domain
LQAFVGGTSPSCLTSPCEFGDNVDQTPRPLIKFVVDPTTSAPVPFDPPGGVLRSGADAITKVSETTTEGASVTERALLFGFTANLGKNPFATINGQFYNPEQTAAQPVLGSTEVWQLINNTDGYHPVHIHDIEFQVISRSRCPSPNARADLPSNPSDPFDWCKEELEDWSELPAQAGDWASCPDGGASCNLAWTDVFVVPPYSQVTVIGTFTDNVGTYVFHCHNLIHEDAGMMAQFEVVGGDSPVATNSMATPSMATHSMSTHP